MTTLISFFRKIYDYRYLIIQMIKREIAHRYRGSALGFAWSILSPLLMLAVYTFVFSVVFKSRWGTENEHESKIDFALTLFAGMIVFNIFSEIINKAPTLILGNVNYVKKVIFPLEILPLVSIGGILFHGLVSLLVLLVTQILYKGYAPFTIIYLPVILLPLLLAGLGLSWFLAALTVYIRDIAHITGLLTTVLLFLSAIFFPLSALPAQYQKILMLNPVAFIVDTSRNILIFGYPPNWLLLGVMLVLGLLMAAGGYWFFNKMRKGFADVL